MAGLFSFVEHFRSASQALHARRLRTFLAVLGVLGGTCVIISVASVLTGLDRRVSDAAREFGTRAIFVTKLNAGLHLGGLSREEKARKPLTAEDAAAIRERCPSVEVVAIHAMLWGTPAPVLRYRNVELTHYELLGVTPEDFEALEIRMAGGRPLTANDEFHRRDVAVLGADVAARISREAGEVTGKRILIGGREFEVVGVMEAYTTISGENSRDRVVRIPYSVFRKLFPSQKELVFAALAREGRLESAMDEIDGVLRIRRRIGYSEPPNFGVVTAEMFVSEFRGFVAIVGAATVLLSSIGLLVGGIGIMNIMLIAVTERTHEIGVRRAVGALRRDIAWQFLMEAVILAGLGGICGVALGAAIAFAIRDAGTPAAVPLWAVLSGFAVSASTGVLFGLWPALKAARLSPVDALRYE
jgi:putative ABC transport system permease protein